MFGGEGGLMRLCLGPRGAGRHGGLQGLKSSCSGEGWSQPSPAAAAAAAGREEGSQPSPAAAAAGREEAGTKGAALAFNSESGGRLGLVKGIDVMILDVSNLTVFGWRTGRFLSPSVCIHTLDVCRASSACQSSRSRNV